MVLVVKRGVYPWWRATRTLKQGCLLGGAQVLLATASWVGIALDGANVVSLVIASGWSLIALGYVASTLALRQRTRTNGEASASEM